MACPEVHPACLSTEALLKGCDVQRGRRGGPGGQHRNKVETAVRITHRETGITAEASERRSQADNHATTVFRLRVKLALGLRATWSWPSALWEQRSRGGKIAVNASHADLPAVLAESLDVLAMQHGDDAKSAKALGVTRSQLVKFWKRDGAWLAAANAVRENFGRSPLK
ncbi:MAG: peptide chain release factor-like protein [Planctomycetota bacterium]